MENITPATAPATGDQALGASEIIQGIMMRQAQGDTIDVFALVLSLDITDDLSKVRDYLVKQEICTRQEWNKAVHHKRIVDRLGVRPNTSVELVDIWVALKGYRVDYQKVMHVPTSHDMPEINADNLKRNRDMIAYHCITQQREVNTMTLKRDLRLLVDELRMGFSDRSIEDAVSSWFEGKVDARILDVFSDVRYAQGSAHRDATAQAWAAVVSQFCPDEHDAAFVEAVLRKFMWQVKRKMLGLTVSNHLMPVLLGPQGVGKSTFVRDVLLKPIAELVSGADFAEITDNRNIDLWRNFVIFVDEMGYAAKADIDTVKGRITATSLAMRPMRSNDSIQVRQNATFIGCSNKELDQLIRDETGNRRFVGLRFSSKPDWSLIAGVDTLALWNSVDEHGEDPMKPHQAALSQRQEDVRERSQVEQWLEQHQCPTSMVGKKQSAADLYKDYWLWADTYFANRGMDVATWGKEFSRLIKSGQVEGWSRGGRSNGSTTYVYG